MTETKTHTMDELFTAASATPPSTAQYRRIVTGTDSAGRSIFVADETCPHVHKVMDLASFTFTEIWKTGAEVEVGPNDDPAAGPAALMPPANGTVFRILEMPPDGEWAALYPHIPAPTMHRSATVDYAFVLEGEVWAVLDDSEKHMRAGDALIQQGTNHGWANRSERPCRILFVLIDAPEN
jgi:mannose-6-phosphate isomerase-like protein (cupin superfamily)